MTDTRQVLFKHEPAGLPTPDAFEFAAATLPALRDGQVLLRHLYLSLDPYQRMLMSPRWKFRGGAMTPGQVMVGRCVAEVAESRNSDIPAGAHVVGGFGWQTHSISDGGNIEFIVKHRDNVPLSAYLGACGNSGVTAWGGLKFIGDPQPGETVLVSAAAGSVGCVVGQLAKAWGCRAVGVAGGPEKCRVAERDFGFDACVDYKADGDLSARVREAAPSGVDVYFDNVGGDMLDGVLTTLNNYARVPVCGVLSQYSADGDGAPWPGVRNTRLIFDKRLRIQGFLQSDFGDKGDEIRARLADLAASRVLTIKETIADGIDAAPEAFIGMLQGANTGKQLVKVA